MNTGKATNEKLLTPAEVSELLSVSEGTLAVWRCTKRYVLPYIKAGRAVRYRPAAVEKFLNDRTHSCELASA